MGGAEPLGISKADQTVLVRFMKSQIWHQLVSTVGGGFSKGTMTSIHLDARYLFLPVYNALLLSALMKSTISTVVACPLE